MKQQLCDIYLTQVAILLVTRTNQIEYIGFWFVPTSINKVKKQNLMKHKLQQ